MDKKAILFGQVIFLIVAVLALVIVIYVLMAQGLGGAVSSQTFVMTCTMSSYSRGVIVKALSPFLNMIGAAMLGVNAMTTYFDVDTLKYNLLSPGLGVAVSEFNTLRALPEGMDNAISFKYFTLSNIPFTCPSITLDVGKKDKRATPDEVYNDIGKAVTNAYDMMARGTLDPLEGADPPNPRTIFVLETHANQSINLKDAYNWIKERFPEQSTEWFGNAESAKIFVYCTEGIGNNPNDFDKCEFKDARIYVLYKDEHGIAPYTSGTHLCYPHIQQDVLYFSGEFTHENVGFRDRIDLSSTSPWRVDKDVIVLCVEKF